MKHERESYRHLNIPDEAFEKIEFAAWCEAVRMAHRLGRSNEGRVLDEIDDALMLNDVQDHQHACVEQFAAQWLVEHGSDPARSEWGDANSHVHDALLYGHKMLVQQMMVNAEETREKVVLDVLKKPGGVHYIKSMPKVLGDVVKFRRWPGAFKEK